MLIDWSAGARICYGPSFNVAQCKTAWATPYVLDYNGDGISDLAVYNAPFGQLSFCPGPSHTSCVTAAPAFWSRSFIVGDFNGDGLMDLFSWNPNDPSGADGNGYFCDVATLLYEGHCRTHG